MQDYLNSIHTLQSRFQQITGEGGIATGTLYLSRPGHMRVEYDPPVPVLLVATDGRIWYYDKELEQSVSSTLKDTPAWFLLQDNVSFGGDHHCQQSRARSAARCASPSPRPKIPISATPPWC